MAGTTARTKKSGKAATVGVREHARDLTIRMFGDKKFGRKDLSKVVGTVLHDAVEGVRDAAPKSQKSVLREVFGGLSDAVTITAHAGVGAAKDAKTRGEKVLKHDATSATKRVREAHGEFLDAVSSFSRKLTGEVREEMTGLVAQARKTAPKVSAAAGDAVRAADGRLVELGGEAVRTGAKVARKTIGGVMLAAGGLLEGLAESISPSKGTSSSTKKAPSRAKTTPAKKSGKKTKRRVK